MLLRCLLIAGLGQIGFAVFTSTVTAAQQVTVVVGRDAPDLERSAAHALSTQFKKLFGVDTLLASDPPEGDSVGVYVGSPHTNPLIQAQFPGAWPQVSEQGIVIRSVRAKEHRGLIVGGGSPAATLWAVYELGYRFGVRYLLREDIYPDTPIAMNLDGIDVVQEPRLRTRTWRTINDFAIGPESWPLKDHKRLLGQLAKMKFNRVMLSIYPWHPFVHYECRGVKKRTGVLWFGEQLRIPQDAPGQAAFRGATLFENPDFAGLRSYQEMTEAGIRHVRGIVEEAHRLGMSVGISISPLEFPREFAPALPGATATRGLKNLLVGPGPGQRFDDPVLRELVRSKLRAYLTTYPQIDAIYLTLPEFPKWDAHVGDAWQNLTSGFASGTPRLDPMLQAASGRRLVASGERGVRSLQGNIVALAFLKNLLEDADLLKRPDGRSVELVFTGVDPELYPFLDRVLPPGAATLNFVDYTARRVAENRDYLSRIPADKVRSRLILTLADDNVGILSQSATRRLGTLVEEILKRGWDGFSTRYWMLAELDPAIHYLSRVAWDPQVTPRNAHDDLFTTITGKQSVSDRLWLGFGHIEQATEIIDRSDLGFAFPVPGMLLKHYQAQPVPKHWDEITEHYTNAMIEMYRSNGASHRRSRQLLFYWAKRSEYVLEYLASLKALREAAIAQKSGQRELAIEQLEIAVEQLYNAIDTLSDVARDQSDLGLIAVLNAYAYRPLVAEYEKLASDE